LATAHKMPRYWLIMIWLAVLTVAEIAVIYAPMAKMAIAMLTKALLVAMYFMHLRFEPRTLGLIALTPLILCVFLLFMLVPDHSAVPHKTTVTETAEHSTAPE